jgi:hypothetical protein
LIPPTIDSDIFFTNVLWMSDCRVRKLSPDEGKWIGMFKDMERKQENRIIIDCDVSKVGKVLQKVYTNASM